MCVCVCVCVFFILDGCKPLRTPTTRRAAGGKAAAKGCGSPSQRQAAQDSADALQGQLRCKAVNRRGCEDEQQQGNTGKRGSAVSREQGLGLPAAKRRSGCSATLVTRWLSVLSIAKLPSGAIPSKPEHRPHRVLGIGCSIRPLAIA